jgi:hypothetical protein
MNYVLLYVLIGALLSFIFDVLNEFFLHPDDKIKFDWGIRVINAIIWPYVLGAFINCFVNHNR